MAITFLTYANKVDTKWCSPIFLDFIIYHRLSVETNTAPNLPQSSPELNIPFTLLITLKPFPSVEWRYKRKVFRKSFRFICQIFCHRLSVEKNIAPNLSQSPSELNIPFTLLITLKPFSSVEWSCGKVSNLTTVIDNHYFACLL